MRSADIRTSFLEFFERNGHRVTPSAPLVPHGDRTLLFTNAGMVPFKDYFLGTEEPPSPRAVSSQKCMRVSGKHNDLENVGPSHRHHTFFEMLGNFSFGDYFKEEAIRFGWELVTEGWAIPPERLFATVFEEDDEAAELWREISGLAPERVLRCGAKDNFWAMGDTGPCGPCSEIFVDLAPEEPAIDWEEGSESGRYLEIWNLVFMQFERNAKGELEPLPNPSIDTGAGLERVSAVLQGVDSNYDSDLFRPILSATEDLSGIAYGAARGTDVDMRVIADHLRAVTFLLADGVIPSNEGRGYVLRRILRRAVRHGMSLGFEEPFLGRLAPVVTEVMGATYPELTASEAASKVTLETEERKFLETLATGSRQVQTAIDRLRAGGGEALDGETVFRLYDTFGLPIEIIREIAEEERVGLDEAGFSAALDGQRARSRAAAEGGHERLAQAAALLRDRLESETRFEGYRQLELAGASVLALAKLGEEGEAELAESLSPGEEGVAVLESTPFYAESGGQLGDRGCLEWPEGGAEVVDVQKEKGLVLHLVRVDRGELASGGSVSARVDPAWRRPTQRNHTATHLLHAALRHVLGEGVRQAGSLVAPDRLRFDFTFGRPLTPEELARIEDIVNAWVLQATPTEITAERDFDEAVAAGAMALFGEKYGDTVRTVEVPPLDWTGAEGATERVESLELCGGCHVANIGEIGLFSITSERGVASGVRRIEARTGEGARALAQEQADLIASLAGALSVSREKLPREVASMAERQRELEREVSKLRMKLVSGGSEERDEIEVEGIKVLVREVPPAPVAELRNMADVMKAKLGSGVVVLGSRDDGKVHLLAAVSTDLVEKVHAGRLAGSVAEKVGGRGGGKAEFAQAGGKNTEELPAALAAVPEIVRAQIAEGGGSS